MTFAFSIPLRGVEHSSRSVVNRPGIEPEEVPNHMSIGASIFLIAVGAILEFAVTVQDSKGFDLNAIGVILMVVGAIGLFISLFWTRRVDRLGTPVRRETVVHERDVI